MSGIASPQDISINRRHSHSHSQSYNHNNIQNTNIQSNNEQSIYDNAFPFYHSDPKNLLSVRVDNLPPGKNWKEVKYLIGGIIHHSNIVKVKILPPVTGIVPPFVTFQSCIVSLKNNLSPDTINELLLTLNSYQWDYHDLYAYVLPMFENFTPMPQQYPLFNYTTEPVRVDNFRPTTPEQDEKKLNTLQNQYPIMPAITPQPSLPHPQLQPHQQGFTMTHSKSPLSGPSSGGSPTHFNSPLATVYPIYPPPIQPLQQGLFPIPLQLLPDAGPHQSHRQSSNQQPAFNRRFFYHQSSMSRYRTPITSMTSTSSPDEPITGGTNQQGFGSVPGAPLIISKRNANPFKQPKKLKSIFNERNFRKQMTDRGMWQLKLINFPPYLIPETEHLINPESEPNLNVDIETDSIEKYGKLRWTVLKDYVKLKCPKLLNLQESNHPEVSIDNTREFYVGVYEDHEDHRVIKMGDTFFTMEAIFYSAIIGFHNKELSELCYKALKDQEYSLGYNLDVRELSPFEEDDRERKQETNVDENENISNEAND